MTVNGFRTNNSEMRTLLSRKNILSYFYTLFVIVLVIALYYLLLGPAAAMPFPDGRPPHGPPNHPPSSGLGSGIMNSWPLWGQFVIPTLPELTITTGILAVFGGIIYFYRRTKVFPSFPQVVIIGLLLIIVTNLIHGWQIGLEEPISGASEIFNDISKISTVSDFISNYELLQPTLTVHAQTHPPGAVLSIYYLYLLFRSPSFIAIGLCSITAVGSAFFLRGVMHHLFDEELARYATFLYLILPAVQVYYLANIYAIVATLVLGVLYFYLHTDRRVAFTGSFISLLLLTFITFLSAFVVLFLFTYEILTSFSDKETISFLDRVKVTLWSLREPLLLTFCISLSYILMFVFLDFNYLNTFLYASTLENPNGYQLLANPLEYFLTRIQDVLDIVIFFGPVLSVFAYRGFLILRKQVIESSKLSMRYNIVTAALIALGLLFLAGTPKKGETARICLFILPILLILVITYIERTNMCWKDKILLLALVFGQAVLMQLLGIWIW